KQGSIVSDFRISLTLGGPMRTIRSHSRSIRPSPRDSSVTGPARRQGLDLKALDRIFERARAASCRIVLSETGDRRIIEAASWASREGLARICLVGDEAVPRNLAGELGVDLGAIELVDPTRSPLTPMFARELLALRKHKGMSLEQACRDVLDPLCFA